MPVQQFNASKPKRAQRGLSAIVVDTSVTPPSTPYNGSPQAGSVSSGELLYATSNLKAASLATAGTLPTTTTGASIASTGFQHVNLSQVSGILVGMYLTIDTAGNLEVVQVISVDPSGIQADFTKTHSSGVAVTCTNANTANFIGVSNDVYPYTYTAGVTGAPVPVGDPSSPYVKVFEDGDHLFNTTNGDTYHAFDPVFLGSDGRTISKTANGMSVGYVSPDQRASNANSAPPPSLPISGGAGVQIYIHILPVLAK